MSVYVTREVWKYSRAEHGARLTLLAIADSAHKELGTSMLKQRTISGMTLLGQTAVRDAIRWLEDEVEIETRQAVKGRARINVYRIVLGDYALVEVDEDELACRLLEPFSTRDELAAIKAEKTGDDRRNPTLVNLATTVGKRGGDRRNPVLHKEEPVLEPLTEEPKGSSVPAAAGERKTSISLGLSAEIGVELRGMTRPERRKWEVAVAELTRAGATAEQVKARCAAYRLLWPDVKLTAWALVSHWADLGGEADRGLGADPIAGWCEHAPELFELEMARELLDDRPGLNDDQLAGYHRLLDEAYAMHRQVA